MKKHFVLLRAVRYEPIARTRLATPFGASPPAAPSHDEENRQGRQHTDADQFPIHRSLPYNEPQALASRGFRADQGPQPDHRTARLRGLSNGLLATRFPRR